MMVWSIESERIEVVIDGVRYPNASLRNCSELKDVSTVNLASENLNCHGVPFLKLLPERLNQVFY